MAAAELSRHSILKAVTKAQKAVTGWRAADVPNVNWRGGTVKSMSDAVLEELDELAELAGNCVDAEPEARAIVLAIDAMAEQLVGWAAAVEIDPQSVHPSGTPDLWAAYERTIEATQEPPRRLPEPISELMDQGVSLEQIAKIYGFFDDSGRPSSRMVVEETQKPGTHFDSDTWTEPARRRRQAEVDQRWAQRTPVHHERLTGERARPVAPESVEQLLAEEVSVKQIARMKNISEAEVEQIAAEIGIAADGRFRRPPLTPTEQQQKQAERAQRQTDRYADSHPELEVMEERILACWADDWKATEIAEVLSVDWPGLTWQKANAVIKAFEKSEEAEAVA